MKDIRQAPAWAIYLDNIGWKVEKINNTYYFLKKLPLLGYLLKIQRVERVDEAAIKKLTHKYRVWKIVIEPLKEITDYPLSKSFYLPTKTLQISLNKSKESLLKEMSPKTRYNIKQATKNNLKLVNSDDVFLFVDFWRTNFESKRFPFMSQRKNIIELFKAFGKDAHILFAYRNKDIAAALLTLESNKITYYMYAASNDIGRKLFAPTMLTWEAILLAKRKGCNIFDFDGIYDERFPLKSWLGFTKFKKGFGGKEIKYPGSYTKSAGINV